MSYPSLLIYGAKKGMSMKDAQAFIRALAERRCETPDITYYRLQKDGDRILYEIQEGRGVSMMEEIKAALSASGEAWVQLTNDRIAEIVPDGVEYVTVIHQDDVEGKPLIQLDENGKKKKMTPLVSDRKWMLIAGGAFAGIGALFFLISAGIGAYAKAPSKPVVAQLEHKLPSDELAKIQLGPGEYIYAFRFVNGEYTVNILNALAPAAELAQEEAENAEAAEPAQTDEADAQS